MPSTNSYVVCSWYFSPANTSKDCEHLGQLTSPKGKVLAVVSIYSQVSRSNKDFACLKRNLYMTTEKVKRRSEHLRKESKSTPLEN